MVEGVGGIVHSVEDPITENKALVVAQQETRRVGKLEGFLEGDLLATDHLAHLDQGEDDHDRIDDNRGHCTEVCIEASNKITQ